MNRKYVEAVIQIWPIVAGLRLLLKIPVCGGNHAHADFEGLRATDPFELAFLQHAQQFRLQIQRQFTDLVEEDGSFVGQLEATHFLRERAGEGALLMTEQFAFDQAGWDGRAIDFDEGPTLRGLKLWIARAISSLPVPVSPVMSTVESVGATRSTFLSTFFSEVDPPINSSKLWVP